MSDVRIIGGKFRGKKIYFPNKSNLRPTPNRVREMLFNWLMHDIKGASCLDLFAGSGALGFEAYSRGAREVVLVEKDSTSFKFLNKNLEYFYSDTEFFEDKYLKTIHSHAEYFLKHNKKQFDIVFIDPPFKSNYIKIIELLLKTGVLNEQALLYIESGIALELDEKKFTLLKVKKSGDVYTQLYKKI